LAVARAINPTVIKDLLFLDDGDSGFIPTLSAFVRARQICRASPVFAVAGR